MKIIEQSLEESNTYSLFVYSEWSQVTSDYYLRRLRIFFNHINLQTNITIEERCNYFTNNGTKDPTWIFNCIVRFLQYQKNRVENKEITGATLQNFIKAIKLLWNVWYSYPMEKDYKRITKKYSNIVYYSIESKNSFLKM
jgi:hypothetical protein